MPRQLALMSAHSDDGEIDKTMSNQIPPLDTVSRQREPLPPDPTRWQRVVIKDLKQQPDGTFTGLMIWETADQSGQGLPYHIQSYRKEDGMIKFSAQARECAQSRREWERYLFNISSNMASG